MKPLVLFAALAMLVSAAPALACSPEPFAAGTSESHGKCAVSYYDDEITRRGTGYVEDLGGGFVSQYYTEGNICYMTASMIVIDCNAGQAAVFGPGPTVGAGAGDDKGSVFKQLETQLLRAAKAGQPMPISEIAAHARGAGFANAAQITVPARVGLSNDNTAPRHSFDLGCGCKLFYPGSTGAGS